MTKAIIALVLLGGALAYVVHGGTRIPDAVQPIAWNKEACAHCHMLIGDPAYAAQVITSDGDVLSFDDPGCAIRYLREHPDRVRHAWFHAGRGDTWLAADDVAFARVAASPMGSNLIAVARTTPGALALEDVP